MDEGRWNVGWRGARGVHERREVLTRRNALVVPAGEAEEFERIRSNVPCRLDGGKKRTAAEELVEGLSLPYALRDGADLDRGHGPAALSGLRPACEGGAAGRLRRVHAGWRLPGRHRRAGGRGDARRGAAVEVRRRDGAGVGEANAWKWTVSGFADRWRAPGPSLPVTRHRLHRRRSIGRADCVRRPLSATVFEPRKSNKHHARRWRASSASAAPTHKMREKHAVAQVPGSRHSVTGKV